MINVGFLNIDNSKLVGRLLPYWARGKNTSLLLQAILSPITSVHNNFKLWALEQYIYAHITSQAMSIEWYLKYRLKSHFVNEAHSFIVSDEEVVIDWNDYPETEEPDTEDPEEEPGAGGVVNVYTCFGGEMWMNEFVWENNALWSLSQAEAEAAAYSTDEEEGSEGETETGKGEYIYVYAPEIVSTISYNQDDYVRDINYIVSQFMTNFKAIKIIIINKQ